MAGERTLKVTILGDAESVAKAFRSTGEGAASAEVKVDGFGKSFTKYAVGAALAAAATAAVTGAISDGVGAVNDYNKSIDLAERQLLGMTKSQAETNAALAVARKEADAGRGTYESLAGAMAGLTSVAKTANRTLADVTETAEILAAINPEEGIKGATFALREAASGDMTSVIERFNLSRSTINQLRAEGVPAIEAVRRAMQQMGYDTEFLAQVNGSAAKQGEILKGRLVELAAVVEKPIFDKLIAGLDAFTKKANDPGALSFAERIATEIRVLLAGKVFDQLAVDIAKSFFLIGDSFNNLLKTLSGGKLNIDEGLKDFFDDINARQAKITAAVNKGVGQPVADGLSGKAPGSPLAASTVKGYGADVLRNYLAGFDTSQLDALDKLTEVVADKFKGNDTGLNQVRAILAQAIGEIQAFGRISDGTFGASEGTIGAYGSAVGATSNTLAALTQALGAQAPEVLRLLQLYQQSNEAQTAASFAAGNLASAQAHLSEVQRQAANDLAALNTRLAQYQGVAQRDAAASAAAVAGVQAEIAGVQAAAEQSARDASDAISGLQDELAGLQAGAAGRAAAFDAAIKAAQDAASAASEKRRRDSALTQAAIRGETEAYLAQLPVIDDATRALAARNEAIIGGARAARDAANEQVRQLTAKANKEDLGQLTQIKAARESGDEKGARALQRQLDAKRKGRQDDIELARAQAAVAGDEFDEKARALEKEATQRDIVNAKAEDAAKARVAEIQGQAAQQKAADDAAIAAKQAQIKAAQEEQQQNARNAADRQRQLQAEITEIQRRAAIQAIEAQTTEAGLKAGIALRTSFWNQEETRAGALVTVAQSQATAAERQATAAERTLAAEEARLKLYQQYGVAPGQTAPVPSGGAGGGAVGGGTDDRAGTSQASGAGGDDAWLRNYAAANWGPAIPGGSPPPGWHREQGATGVWWVRDGWHLNATATGVLRDGTPTPAPAPGPSPTPRTSGGSGGGGGSSYQQLDGGARSAIREAGAGGAGGGPVTFNFTINAPNLTNLGDAAQQRALAARNEAAAIRAWDQIARGGEGGVV